MQKIIACCVTFFCLLFWACQNGSLETKKQDFLNDAQISERQKFIRLLEEGHPDLPLSQEERKQLMDFYKARGYQRIFTNDSTYSAEGTSWITTLQKHEYFGLAQNRFVSSKNSKLVIQELLLHFNIGIALNDLDSGFIDFERTQYKKRNWRALPKEYLNRKISKDSVLLSRGPADSNYRYFAQHLYHFRDTAQIDTTFFELITEKENKKLAWEKLKFALLTKGLITENIDSLNIRKVLRGYQKSYGLIADGMVGQATVISFAESGRDRFTRAMIALDRLRQEKIKPKSYISINIPSFYLNFVSDDTLRAQHKIIVGKIDHPTPILESRITRIISLPYWKVPSSIAKNEVLPALKRNATYLTKEHMRIFKSQQREVNPTSINWKKIKDKTFPYQIIQDPGPWNSLGLIKFEFANNFSVYVHDTPSRYLFGQRYRSFSHGCMRCDQPIELGKAILNFDKTSKKENPVSPDSLQVLIDMQIHQSIPLLKSLPIFVGYQSVTTDRKGIYFHLDLYQKDQPFIRLVQTENNG
ncbi:MAG: L,D-transpeptidase family protein [Flavobacteriales bacterium]